MLKDTKQIDMKSNNRNNRRAPARQNQCHHQCAKRRLKPALAFAMAEFSEEGLQLPIEYTAKTLIKLDIIMEMIADRGDFDGFVMQMLISLIPNTSQQNQ